MLTPALPHLLYIHFKAVNSETTGVNPGSATFTVDLTSSVDIHITPMHVNPKFRPVIQTEVCSSPKAARICNLTFH